MKAISKHVKAQSHALPASPAFVDEILALAAHQPRAEFFPRLHQMMRERIGAQAFAAAAAGAPTDFSSRNYYRAGFADGDGPGIRLEPSIVFEALLADTSVVRALPSGGSLIVAPISADGTGRAYLAVGSPRDDAFGSQELEFVEAAAKIASLVLVALAAADTADARSEEVRMLLATARALASERDLQRLFERFHELVATIMDGDTFYIALGSYDTRKMEYPYAVEQNKRIEFTSTDIDATVAGYVFKEGQSFLLNETKDWKQLSMGYLIEGLEVTSAIFAPMRIGERTIGVISVQSVQPHAYTERDRDLLVAIAEQAAIAVENSQYLQRAERRAIELKSLADVARALAAQMGLKTLYRTVCREVRRVVDAPVFYVALVAEDQLVMQYAIEGAIELDIPPYSFEQSVSERVIRSNEPVVLHTSPDPYKPLYQSGRVVRSLVIVPLRLMNRVIGVMACQSYSEHAYEPANVDLLTSIAEQLALAVQNAQLYNEAKIRADLDPLTNLFHHRYLKTRLEEEVDRSRHVGQPLSVLMLDIDRFKLFNDTYGHLAGDELLKRTAALLTRECRSSDIVGRYGGDEFMAILPDADRNRAANIADRIAEKVLSLQVEVPDDRPIGIHCSIGVASYPIDAKTSEELIHRADQRLYQSKRSGRMQRVGATQMRLIGDFSPVSELIAALLARDPATRAHLEHVNYVAAQFARMLGLSEANTNSLLLASVLHDVGKIAIPDKVLRKPGRLTDGEYALARKHPELGALLIAHHPGFEDASIAVRHHHEWFDGTGYPDGRRGEQIPLLARIVSIIDAYSAMTVDRPYHRSRTTDEAVAELRRCAGTQFDPKLVERFATLVERGGVR